MDPKATLKSDLTAAMKAKETVKVSVLRMTHAELQKREIDKKSPLSEEEFLKMVTTLVKQRRESIDQFKKGGRQDLIEKEESEIKILEAYLPEQLSDAEIEAIVTAAISNTSASGPQDMGKVMQAVMAKTAGRADGKKVSQVVRAKLSG